MSLMHDGEAVRVRRVLSSHRSALTALDTHWSELPSGKVKWVDVGCGRGQILGYVDKMLGTHRIERIEYVGCDGDPHYCAETKQQALEVGLVDPKTVHLDFSELGDHFSSGQAHFITLVNVTHELRVPVLAATLFDCTSLLECRGLFHISDISALEKAELDSVCWTAPEITEVLEPLSGLLGMSKDECNVMDMPIGWSVSLKGSHIRTARDARLAARTETIEAMVTIARSLLPKKVDERNRVLEAYAANPSELRSDSERQQADQAVYEFWTMTHWLKETGV